MTVLWDYWRSSASYRLRIGLGLAKIPFEARSVDLVAGDHRTEAHLARNPQGLVPVLEIDGQQLTQSLAILEYLDETRNLGWLPQSAPERARVRRIAQAIAMEIHPVCNLSVARFATNAAPDLEMKDWMQRFIAPGLAAVEKMLDDAASGAFCHGDQPGLADICLVPQIYNARRWEVNLSAMPHLVAIDARMQALAPVAAAHPDQFKPR